MSYPQRLLENIYWTSKIERYPSREKFEKEVRTYQHKINKTDENWQPELIALKHPSAMIQFRCWVNGEEEEPNFLIEADNGQSFTVLELFHKLCDGIGQTLMERNAQLHNYCFFEGLSLHRQDKDPPLYFVHFGS